MSTPRPAPPADEPAAVQAAFAATLVDEWVRAGLSDAVVCPGSRSTPLALALAEADGHGHLRVHVHQDERSGAFLALGIGLATGRPAVVLTTSGTAAAELHPAVVEADLAAVPLLVCTADRPPELRDVGAPQAIDQVHLYGRSVRWYGDPGVPDAASDSRWRAFAARAHAATGGARPGPVHLNLPFREPLVGDARTLPPGRADGGPWTRAVAVTSAPSTDLADLAAALAGRRGMLVAGVATAGGRPGASRVVNEWLAAAVATEIVAGAPGWSDPSATAAVLVDDAAGLVAALTAAAATTAPPAGWHDAWLAAAGAARAAADGELTPATAGIVGSSEPVIARAVVRGVGAGTSLVVSSSMPIRDVERYAVPRREVRVLANRGANGIDGVVSTAVGVALGSATPAALLIGDVAFLHDSNGLLGAAGRGIDLVCVVVDNDGGGIFSFLPQARALPAERFETLFGTPHGLDLVAVAAAFGVPARRLDPREEVTGAVAEAAAEGGVHVLVVPTERAANVEAHRRVDDAIAAAVEAALAG